MSALTSFGPVLCRFAQEVKVNYRLMQGFRVYDFAGFHLDDALDLLHSCFEKPDLPEGIQH